LGKQGEMVTELQDLRDDGMWMQLEEMGERPDLLRDPFEDDEPLECGLDTPEVCESCQ
jgi:hypothetical protein